MSESKKWPLPMPSVTTFGNAPQVTDIETRKAYWCWIAARVFYECFRWVCWTILTMTVTRGIENLAGMGIEASGLG